MAENDEVRVSFGTHASDTVPVEWAAKMLTLLRQVSPSLFGGLLAQAVTGEAPRRVRSDRESSQ